MSYNRHMKKLFRGERGQTAVEYILILTVAISIGIAFTKAMKKYMLENPNSYINIQLRRLDANFDNANGYKYYRIP